VTVPYVPAEPKLIAKLSDLECRVIRHDHQDSFFAANRETGDIAT